MGCFEQGRISGEDLHADIRAIVVIVVLRQIYILCFHFPFATPESFPTINWRAPSEGSQRQYPSDTKAELFCLCGYPRSGQQAVGRYQRTACKYSDNALSSASCTCHGFLRIHSIPQQQPHSRTRGTAILKALYKTHAGGVGALPQYRKFVCNRSPDVSHMGRMMGLSRHCWYSVVVHFREKRALVVSA